MCNILENTSKQSQRFAQRKHSSHSSLCQVNGYGIYQEWIMVVNYNWLYALQLAVLQMFCILRPVNSVLLQQYIESAVALSM